MVTKPADQSVSEKPAAADKPQKQPPLSKWLIPVAIVLVVLLVAGGVALVIHNKDVQRQAAAAKKAEQGLGSMHYVSDIAKLVQTAYSPTATAPTTLSATDSRGYTWTLSIPVGALADAETISLTPFSSVSGPTGQTITTGVTFSPDGLMFDKPATVKVTPPAGSPAPLQLYTSKQDGSQLAYADTIGQSANTALIYHFSGAGAGTRSLNLSDAQLQLDSLLAATRDFLKTGNTSLPPPPNVQLHCIGVNGPDSNMAAIHSYVRSALEPERSIAFDLIGDLARVEASGGNSNQSDEVMGVVAQLMDRVASRTSDAIAQNRNNMNSFPALSAVAVKVSQLLLISGRENTPLIDTVDNWAIQLANKSLDDVRTHHKYSDFPEIQYLYAAALLLGNPPDNFYQSIQKAFTFDMNINEVYDSPTFGVNLTGTGDVKLVPEQLGTANSKFTGQGTLSVSNSYGALSSAYSQTAVSFDTTGVMNLLNICTNPQVQLSQSQYGPSQDTLVQLGDLSSPYGALQDMFSNYVAVTNPSGVFTLSAHDGNAQLASQSWSNTYSDPTSGTANFTLGYKLTHTPK